MGPVLRARFSRHECMTRGCLLYILSFQICTLFGCFHAAYLQFSYSLCGSSAAYKANTSGPELNFSYTFNLFKSTWSTSTHIFCSSACLGEMCLLCMSDFLWGFFWHNKCRRVSTLVIIGYQGVKSSEQHLLLPQNLVIMKRYWWLQVSCLMNSDIDPASVPFWQWPSRLPALIQNWHNAMQLVARQRRCHISKSQLHRHRYIKSSNNCFTEHYQMSLFSSGNDFKGLLPRALRFNMQSKEKSRV